MFPEMDPLVLHEMYIQVNKSKELLIETMLNGGVVPDDLNE